MKKLILLSTFIGIYLCSNAQITQGEFAYGGTKTDAGQTVIQLKDNSYLLTGNGYSFGDTNYEHAYIIKLDADGNIKWSKAIGGGSADDVGGQQIIQTNDRCFAIAGGCTGLGTGAYIIKLDSTGNMKWSECISPGSQGFAHCLVQTYDKGYAMAGGAPGVGIVNFYVVKLDSNGNLLWTKTIGGTYAERALSMVQTYDNGLVITGATQSYGAGGYDIYVVKLDMNGNFEWAKTIGGTGDEQGNYIIQSNDKGLVIAGTTTSYGTGGQDVYIVKLDSAGNLKWTRTIGGTGDDGGIAIIQSSDRGYAIAGSTNSWGAGSYDVYVIKLDSAGNLKWTRTIGGTGDDEGNGIIQTNDKGYAIVGQTTSYGAGRENFYFIKLDSNGNFCHSMINDSGRVSSGGGENSGYMLSSGGVVEIGGLVDSGGIETNICSVNFSSVSTIIANNISIDIYPNPTSGNIILTGVNSGQVIELYNIMGQEIIHNIINEPTTELDLSKIPTDVYLIRILSSEGTVLAQKKIIKVE